MFGDEFNTGGSVDGNAEFSDGYEFVSGQAETGNAETGNADSVFSDGIGIGFIGSDESGSAVRETGTNSGNAGKEKEETAFLVGDEGLIAGQALEESIINALNAVFSDDDAALTVGQTEEELTPTPTVTISSTPVPATVHDIDDIYELCESIENYESLTYMDNLQYHKAQDIIGRVSIGLFSFILGGLIAVVFIGRIR